MKKPISLVCTYREFTTVPILPPLCIAAMQFTRVSTEHLNAVVLALVFLFVAITTYLRVWRGMWTIKSIGCTPITMDGICDHIDAILLGVIWFIVWGRFHPSQWNVDWQKILYWSGIGVLAQVFLYQVYLWKVGQELLPNHPWVNFTLNTAFFAGMHFIFPDPWYKMIFIIPGAIMFTLLYKVHQNVFLILPVHMVFNMIAIQEGIFKA